MYRILFYPALLYWFIFRPAVNGVGVIIEKDGKLLMVRHTYGKSGQWHFPGGAIKHGETSDKAAAREISEELGLNLKLTRLGKVRVIHNYKRVNGVCYYAKLKDDKIVKDKKEIAEVALWPYDNLPGEIDPVVHKDMELYLKFIGKTLKAQSGIK